MIWKDQILYLTKINSHIFHLLCNENNNQNNIKYNLCLCPKECPTLSNNGALLHDSLFPNIFH